MGCGASSQVAAEGDDALLDGADVDDNGDVDDGNVALVDAAGQDVELSDLERSVSYFGHAEGEISKVMVQCDQ